MRKLDTDQTNWAIEAYHYVSGIFDDKSKPRDREIIRLDQRDTPTEKIENPFEKLVERLNKNFTRD